MVFNAKVNGKANGTGSLVARARDASTAAAHNATIAAQNAAVASQAAAEAVSSAARTTAVEVNKGVYSARTWAAPRLEDAADYTTDTMAPKVSAALRATARQIAPQDMRRKRTSQTLTWSVLAAAVLAGAGAAAALVRQRYRSAMTADTQEEIADAGTSPGMTSPPATPEQPATNESAAPGTGTTGTAGPGTTGAAGPDTGVNGRVSASGL
jgi:hypothetical protein